MFLAVWLCYEKYAEKWLGVWFACKMVIGKYV